MVRSELRIFAGRCFLLAAMLLPIVGFSSCSQPYSGFLLIHNVSGSKVRLERVIINQKVIGGSNDFISPVTMDKALELAETTTGYMMEFQAPLGSVELTMITRNENNKSEKRSCRLNHKTRRCTFHILYEKEKLTCSGCRSDMMYDIDINDDSYDSR
jgi:hypothetical protein